MSNDDTQKEELVDPEFEYWKRVPAPIRYTMLGHYFATRKTRWLVAFSSYGLAYLGIGIAIFAIIMNFTDTKKAMDIFKQSAWVFTAACGLFCIGGVASYRFHVALGTGVMFLLFLFFHFL